MDQAAVEPYSQVNQLYARLQAARARSEELFKIVRPAALYDRPVPERHRIIFYLGHLEAFDWNLLREALGLSSFDPDFDNLFAFGIDPVEGGLPTDQPKYWPSADRVREYNKRLREKLDGAIWIVGAKDPSLACLEHGRLLEVLPSDTSPDAIETLLHAAPVARGPQIQSSLWQKELSPPPQRLHCVEIPGWNGHVGPSLAAKTVRLVGTMSSRSIALKSPHLRLMPTT